MNNIQMQLKNITKTYYGAEEPVPVLKGITFELNKPEMVAIMGPSGSGKSTLMNIIGCLDKPDSGLYQFCGQNVMTMDRDQLAYLRNRSVGFVFQHFNLLGRSTALENVCLPMHYAGVRGAKAEKRARELLHLVGLDNREMHLPTQLSGGQQQRVAIARALVNNPAILLADEPTGALDSQTSAEIMTMLQELNRQQDLAVVIVTHDPEVAQYCQRLIRLKDGIIVSEETVGAEKEAETGRECAWTC